MAGPGRREFRHLVVVKLALGGVAALRFARSGNLDARDAGFAQLLLDRFGAAQGELLVMLQAAPAVGEGNDAGLAHLVALDAAHRLLQGALGSIRKARRIRLEVDDVLLRLALLRGEGVLHFAAELGHRI